MVTEATKKYREIFAYVLLGVAALYFLSALSLLFKNLDDRGGLDFSDKAAVFGPLFAHPFLIFSLIAAVALVMGFGERSKNARTVVLVALAIGAVSLLLAVICWLASFGAHDFISYGGVQGAGKIVGTLLTIAQLALLALATLFAVAALRTFPRSARAQEQQWGGPQGYGQQQSWGQQEQGYGQPQQGWGQPPQQAWGGQQQPQQAWGAPEVGGATAAGWGDQAQTQAMQQGQPASAWGQPSASPQEGWAQPTEQSGWGQPADQPRTWGQPAEQWGQPAEQTGWASSGEPASAAEPSADETQVWSAGTSHGDEPATSGTTDEPAEQAQPADPAQQQPGEHRDDDEGPPQQGGWWQPANR